MTWMQAQATVGPTIQALWSLLRTGEKVGTAETPWSRANFKRRGILVWCIRRETLHTHRIHGAGTYANIWGILMGSMLPYIAAPWILWDSSRSTCAKKCENMIILQ